MLTGRDLIIYILQNNLEDEPIFKNGKMIGFMTVHEAAAKFNVGVATIFAWLGTGRLVGLIIGSEVLIPVDSKSPLERITN